MFTKDEMDSWNEIFSQCKIEAVHLSHPTEQFLTRTLVVYLRLLGYKEDPPYDICKDEDYSYEKRQLLRGVTRHINHIFKITAGAYNFSYTDLISPTSKKTHHVLSILLNYLYYYHLYKTTVFDGASLRIKMLEELQRGISEAPIENEKCAESVERIKSKIDFIAKQLPAAEIEDKEMRAKYACIAEVIDSVQITTKELAERIKTLITESRSLKKQIVPENEVRNLKAQQDKHRQDITDRVKDLTKNEGGLRESIETANMLEKRRHAMDDCRKIVALPILQKKRALDKQLKAVHEQSNDLNNKRHEYLAAITKMENALKKLEDIVNLEKCEQEKKNRDNDKALKQKEENCNASEQEYRNLNHQAEIVGQALQEQNCIYGYLVSNITVLLATYDTSK